ncbi:MAG: hypothetical protein ACTS5I_03640 [Rhodanobacter sp.]
MATIIGAESVLGATIIGSIEQGHYVMRHGNRVLAREPLRPHAQRMQISGDAMAVIDRMQRTEVGGKFFNKVKKAAKKGVSKVVKGAKKVAKNKATKALYSAAKQAAPSPYKEYIAGAETAVNFTKAIAKGSKKGKAAKKALPTVKALAQGKITLAQAKKKSQALGLKPNTIRDVAASMKLHASKSPAAKAVMSVVTDISKVTESPTRIVEAASGRRYEVLVKPA